MKRSPIPRGFSLVEVTMAIGIVAFALMIVVGLLPVGLQSVKNANEQAGAANVLGAISSALHSATPTTAASGSYTAVFPFATGGNRTITFSLASSTGTPGSTIEWKELTLEGTESADDKRLAAILRLTELPTQSTPGRATASVAWSAASNPQWDPAENEWSAADGSMTSAILFLPR